MSRFFILDMQTAHNGYAGYCLAKMLQCSYVTVNGNKFPPNFVANSAISYSSLNTGQRSRKPPTTRGFFLFLGIFYILCYTNSTGWRPLLNRQSRRCPSVSTSGPSIPPSDLQNLILFSIKKPLCKSLSFRRNFSSIG